MLKGTWHSENHEHIAPLSKIHHPNCFSGCTIFLLVILFHTQRGRHGTVSRTTTQALRWVLSKQQIKVSLQPHSSFVVLEEFNTILRAIVTKTHQTPERFHTLLTPFSTETQSHTPSPSIAIRAGWYHVLRYHSPMHHSRRWSDTCP